ncbi:MAG: acyl carrier protein [Oscillospiraceae bacterium]|nr:acyl carrier protein [Oscillospiraceae bacterium]
MDRIIEILENLHFDVDWENESEFVDSGLIDSFDMIALINDLSDTFGVDIDLEYLEPENFNSVEAIANLLKTLGAAL